MASCHYPLWIFARRVWLNGHVSLAHGTSTINWIYHLVTDAGHIYRPHRPMYKDGELRITWAASVMLVSLVGGSHCPAFHGAAPEFIFSPEKEQTLIRTWKITKVCCIIISATSSVVLSALNYHFSILAGVSIHTAQRASNENMEAI